MKKKPKTNLNSTVNQVTKNSSIMKQTHVFILPSGVECEVSELKSKHQSWLTQQNSNMALAMNKVLCDIIVRVGSISGSGINEDFVDAMLSADRNWILFQVRQFSLEFPEKFESPFEYTSIHTGMKVNDPIKIDLSNVSFNPYPFQVSEYSDIVKDFTIDVKRYEKPIRITLLDGAAEKRIAATKKKDIDISLDITAHNPVYFNNGTPIKVDVPNLGLASVSDLRRQINDLEGRVNADFECPHPEADYMTGGEKTLRVNLLGDINFLFPNLER